MSKENVYKKNHDTWGNRRGAHKPNENNSIKIRSCQLTPKKNANTHGLNFTVLKRFQFFQKNIMGGALKAKGRSLGKKTQKRGKGTEGKGLEEQFKIPKKRLQKKGRQGSV